MTDDPPPSETAALARRRKFLVVVDETPECKVALRFAARRAQHTNGLVTLIYVIEPADFQQWAAVERAMRDEAQREAEAIVHAASREVNEIVGLTPEVYIREGKKVEEVRAILKDDPDISILVLGSSTGNEGPGPLVSIAAGNSQNAFPIPVTIVPGSLTNEEVDALG
ncbi:MAG: universal stress protein [Alphaproteobacteria bacterium]|nr:universal stress protein [Alphaproteobacteria bacterium]